nr:MAG TPA: hypothetical protein [Caudoviricetes sp.]
MFALKSHIRLYQLNSGFYELQHGDKNCVQNFTEICVIN